MSDRNAGRSIHGAPQHARVFAADPVLRLHGDLVEQRLLTTTSLESLERVRFFSRFPAEEREFWPETDWSGIPLNTLLAYADLEPGVRWVEVAGGPLATVLPLDQCHRALLCDRLGGRSIPLENGGPYRLVCPDLSYNFCVKWVDRIAVAIEEPDRSVERIAVVRQRARDARKS